MKTITTTPAAPINDVRSEAEECLDALQCVGGLARESIQNALAISRLIQMAMERPDRKSHFKTFADALQSMTHQLLESSACIEAELVNVGEQWHTHRDLILMTPGIQLPFADGVH